MREKDNLKSWWKESKMKTSCIPRIRCCIKSFKTLQLFTSSPIHEGLKAHYWKQGIMRGLSESKWNKKYNGFSSCAIPDGQSCLLLSRTWQLVLLILVRIWIISLVIKPMLLHLSPKLFPKFPCVPTLIRREWCACTLGKPNPKKLWLL